jgi:aspartyl-tRNA(Asn)/glutamyl-tRNA(Gln) amidotransferase subunit B
MKKIHNIVTYLEISDGNMQEGSFRCDANVSIRKSGEKKLGTRTELKNINSFKFVEKAINYEIQRQIDLREDGKKIKQETRLYDENKNITKSMRSKEEANDYRYFPDPDLLPIEIDNEYILKIKKLMPDLPDVKSKFYKSKYDLTDEQINIILSNKEITNFADKILLLSKISAKRLINHFISSVYLKFNKENFLALEDLIKPNDFYLIIDSIEKKVISKSNLKEILDKIWGKNINISSVIENYSSINENNLDMIDDLIKKIIEKNEKQVKEYKSGKTKIVGFFVGQVLKDAKGSDPSVIKDKIISYLDSI